LIDRSWLADGMVLLNAERGERSVVLVKVAAEVDATPTAIWNVLRACQIAPEYVPNVVSCRSLEVLEDDRAELFVQTVKPAFFVPAFEHVLPRLHTLHAHRRAPRERPHRPHGG
jgi:hypothetical protein